MVHVDYHSLCCSSTVFRNYFGGGGGGGGKDLYYIKDANATPRKCPAVHIMMINKMIREGHYKRHHDGGWA